MDSSHVSALQAKHSALESRIRQELCRPAPNGLELANLKKQKLRLKEVMLSA